MLQRSRALTLLTFLVFLASTTAVVEGQTRRRQRFRQVSVSSMAFECRTFCSEEKLRTPVAELVWRSSEARLKGQRIEVTVYKDGFAKGLYVALGTVKGERSVPFQKTRQYQEPIAALSKLVVVETLTLREQPGMVAVRVEGLEPGLNYFWRVVTASNGRMMAGGTTRCQAPVCPADLQPDQKP